MKKFLAVYTGTKESYERSQWNSMDPAKRKAREAEGVKVWSEWVAKNQGAIVEHGGPLGKTLRASADGVQAITNTMAAYTIVQAETHEAAAKLFEHHPHFMIFPGDSVEIMPCLPTPVQ